MSAFDLVLWRQLGDKPDHVTRVEVLASVFGRTADRVKERFIERDGDFGMPAPGRWTFDLKLRHKALRA